MQSSLFCRTWTAFILTCIISSKKNTSPLRSLLNPLKNLNVLHCLLEAGPVVTFVPQMICSASIAAVTTWMVQLEKKPKEMLYSKSQTHRWLASEKVLQESEYNYSIFVLFFNLPVDTYWWNRLPGYMSLSHKQYSHCPMSKVIKMTAHNHKNFIGFGVLSFSFVCFILKRNENGILFKLLWQRVRSETFLKICH